MPGASGVPECLVLERRTTVTQDRDSERKGSLKSTSPGSVCALPEPPTHNAHGLPVAALLREGVVVGGNSGRKGTSCGAPFDYAIAHLSRPQQACWYDGDPVAAAIGFAARGHHHGIEQVGADFLGKPAEMTDVLVADRL